MINSQATVARCFRSTLNSLPVALIAILLTAVDCSLSVTWAQADDTVAKEKLPIEVKATIVDDETGEPITQMMIQAGRIDPQDPKKITWGYNESLESSKTGHFTTTIKWFEGWTARVVVDGYVPQPIISEAPKSGTTQLELVLRLKKGKLIRGRILDHEGNPVAGVNVFSISPRGSNLYQGQAHENYSDDVDSRAISIATDEQGRFELHAGGAESLAISSKLLDVWTAKITPESDDELQIKLPAPTKLTISVDIAGADDETRVICRLLTSLTNGFDNVRSSRVFMIKNGQSLELNSLPPGKYEFYRLRFHPSVGMGVFLDRTRAELEAGQSSEVKFVRKTGQPVQGIIRWPIKVELTGIILTVESIEPVVNRWDEDKRTRIFDSRSMGGEAFQVKVIPGTSAQFKTETLTPGEYRLNVEAYAAGNSDDRLLAIGNFPAYTASKVIKVTEKSSPDMLTIELKPR